MTMKDYRPAGYWTAPGGEGVNQGYTCQRCGALIALDGLDIHDGVHLGIKSSIVEVTVLTDGPGGGMRYRITRHGSVWTATVIPRDSNHWAAGCEDESHSRPTLAEAIAYIEERQS